MSNKNRFTLLVTIFLTLFLVISSAGCIFQADVTTTANSQTANTGNPSTDLSILSSQKINHITKEQTGESSLNLKVEEDSEGEDATVLSFDADPRDILEDDSVSTLTFSINDPWVLESQNFVEKIHSYMNETHSVEPVTLHMVLYEYDKAGNQIFVGDSPITISADTVSIGNRNGVFIISPDVLASGKYEIVISPYSGLDMETMRFDWFDDLKVVPNAQFNAGSDGLLTPSGIYASEKSWKSVTRSEIAPIPWGFTQTIITADPTIIPIYDANAAYSLMLIDMPWRLHWKINDVPSTSSAKIVDTAKSANLTGTSSTTVTPTPKPSAVTTPSSSSTPKESKMGEKDDDEPEDGEPDDDESDSPKDDGNEDEKVATPTATPTTSATSTATSTVTPTETPVKTSSTSANVASATFKEDYYKNVEFILYSYKDGTYQIVDRFGWNLGYSSDKEQYTKSYQPGIYTLIGYVRGVGVTLDFQQQKVM